MFELLSLSVAEFHPKGGALHTQEVSMRMLMSVKTMGAEEDRKKGEISGAWRPSLGRKNGSVLICIESETETQRDARIFKESNVMNNASNMCVSGCCARPVFSSLRTHHGLAQVISSNARSVNFPPILENSGATLSFSWSFRRYLARPVYLSHRRTPRRHFVL